MIRFYSCLRAAGWSKRNAIIGTWQVMTWRYFPWACRMLDRISVRRQGLPLN